MYVFQISLVGTPPKEETTDAIENLKKNLVETDLIKYFVQGDVTSCEYLKYYFSLFLSDKGQMNKVN